MFHNLIALGVEAHPWTRMDGPMDGSWYVYTICYPLVWGSASKSNVFCSNGGPEKLWTWDHLLCNKIELNLPWSKRWIHMYSYKFYEPFVTFSTSNWASFVRCEIAGLFTALEWLWWVRAPLGWWMQYASLHIGSCIHKDSASTFCYRSFNGLSRIQFEFYWICMEEWIGVVAWHPNPFLKF